MSASDLTLEEQKNVRTTLLLLRARIGSWKPLAKMLHYDSETIGKVVTGRRSVTASLALRVARFVDISIDALLAGEYIPTATCPKCGYVPDFSDEETVVEQGVAKDEP